MRLPQIKLPNAKRLVRALTVVAGSLFAVAAGLSCLRYSFADGLERASYDWPFVWRGVLDTDNIVLVYLDDASALQLNQRVDDVWNRRLHAALLNRLTADGVRLVFYDVSFDQPWPDPAVDGEFAAAIRANGHVVLGGHVDQILRDGQIIEQKTFPPTKVLKSAAAGWGVLVFQPVDADYCVRQIFPGDNLRPAATWKAAELLQAPVTRENRESGPTRWVNYYGPRHSFKEMNFAQALDPAAVPNGLFKDKIVMIGGRSAVGYLSAGRDEFRTPFFRSVHLLTPGLEVHATILLNYLRNEWLTKMPMHGEILLVVLAGMLAGCLSLLRPINATIAAVVLTAGIVVGACWLVWSRHLWFNWVTPAAVQVPLGLVWSTGSQYLLESRRRKELRRAFGFYLSPQMADRIADSDFDLKPGGKLVDVTVIFTDLENFTTMSEKLDPAEVSKILTDYFGQTTRCILANRGTIIKYIGDAVFAAWGAPIDEPQHAMRAAEAACDLRCLTELQIRGKRLRTRIGIHSGRVLAGNLGSEFRFDYTMIGDAVNFASRLESLNKYLSTQVLISDAVRRQLPDGRFITRRLGEFKVAGKSESVVIHELICRCEAQNGESDWIGIFEEGVDVFRSGEFDHARELMTRISAIRGGADGPSEFYLRKIDMLAANGARDGWTGVVELTEK